MCIATYLTADLHKTAKGLSDVHDGRKRLDSDATSTRGLLCGCEELATHVLPIDEALAVVLELGEGLLGS